MAEHDRVYSNETERYHALVSYEDYNKNLSKFLLQIIGDGYPAILETGAGTGRVTEILAPLCGILVGFDLSQTMLKTANKSNQRYSNPFIGFAAADHRWLPLKNNKFDWVISGWSICYLVSWYKDTWKAEVDRALTEFSRILNPDGNVLLIETLGTGKTDPAPPVHLIEYLDYLGFLGFNRQVIRTDYQFPDQQTADDLVDFFFGKEMLPEIKKLPRPVLPECTGLWTLPYSKLINKFPG